MVDFKPKEDMGMMFIQAVTQATKSISQFSQHLYALICGKIVFRTDNHFYYQLSRGALGSIENRKTTLKITQNRKTVIDFNQKRKPNTKPS